MTWRHPAGKKKEGTNPQRISESRILLCTLSVYTYWSLCNQYTIYRFLKQQKQTKSWWSQFSNFVLSVAWRTRESEEPVTSRTENAHFLSDRIEKDDTKKTWTTGKTSQRKKKAVLGAAGYQPPKATGKRNPTGIEANATVAAVAAAPWKDSAFHTERARV